MSLFRSGPAALLGVLLLGACQSEQPSQAEDTEEETPPVPVETSVPVRGDVFAMYTGTAPIEAFAEANVIAKVDGEVRELLIEEGDDVSKGQVLARLDGDRLRLELNESEAKLRKLQRDYERNIDLQAKGLISDGDFEKIKYEMEALEAAFNLASLELDYTQIRAPIDGVIAERLVKLGNTISVGEALFKVTSLTPLVAYLHVPEREYRHIDPGQPVGIDIDALPGEPIAATVSRVSPVVDPQTGTFKITVEIVDMKRRIKPGMFGRIGVIYDVHEGALQIPRSAIIEDQGTASVFVVEEDRAVRKTIKTGYSNRGMVEVTSGLQDGEQVVTVGQASLKQDSRVSIIKQAGNAELAAEANEEGDEQQGSVDATSD
ncbi:MAG: efflux RND transporter periplasmic adaptor subunit [Gammaproteobacteria bacterium]|jgi:membrane fusion protein (multidrug efflux system)|nr:efflux RND transporter periplasmic adaptor subunit [Gammaproteobacteria bacterium]MDH3756764.1 efflux RND transporter periplasmic adaptor subunit [Gammaproteobacteria bacterium]MDH3846930.1 efflux RND transporter periplasmic adaptor subunit [Gammaproteobacteria bacterium]MDH3862628.1 efflux RND transporter periplasmic adaptor subunit [Gammaproteobacteria bacterium]MDH3905075.1 efflux RND transporter periplasmic adaptor subunit [Gammaproteobacteria bacterium]